MIDAVNCKGKNKRLELALNQGTHGIALFFLQHKNLAGKFYQILGFLLDALSEAKPWLSSDKGSWSSRLESPESLRSAGPTDFLSWEANRASGDWRSSSYNCCNFQVSTWPGTYKKHTHSFPSSPFVSNFAGKKGKQFSLLIHVLNARVNLFVVLLALTIMGLHWYNIP